MHTNSHKPQMKKNVTVHSFIWCLATFLDSCFHCGLFNHIRWHWKENFKGLKLQPVESSKKVNRSQISCKKWFSLLRGIYYRNKCIVSKLMTHNVFSSENDHLIFLPGYISTEKITPTHTEPTINSLNMENKTIIVYAKLPNILQMC